MPSAFSKEKESSSEPIMNWFSWLSKSNLEPRLVYDYGLLLMNNELEEEDIAFFDNGFLQSMGISIAKHRLEILKLASKTRRAALQLVLPPPLPKLTAAAIRKSKNCLTKYMGALGCSSSTSAAILVPSTVRRSSSSPSPRSEGIMPRRKTKMKLLKGGRLVMAERGVSVARVTSSRSHGGGPVVHGGGSDGYWESAAGGIVRWDSMFQNLKPT
ncbi:hypothetical protein Cni_G22299 [Canna indica]|uniref:SAM domain-containing protein n=1 Tax=Canna indica TaxID=4628 RepID=A0AAQ3QJF8_9LILI|nr:hypothetical protein Cni_G22299 [Canna indica]